MFDEKQFELIAKKYGHYASWALWADEGEKPKDNMGDLSIFDIEKNKDLLKQIKPNIILVGLNISRRIFVACADDFVAGKSVEKYLPSDEEAEEIVRKIQEEEGSSGA